MSGDDIEIDVIGGYRVGGAVILLCSLGFLGLIALPRSHPPGTPLPSPIPFATLTAAVALLGLYLCLAVSRVRISPRDGRATVTRGVWPFVVRRTEDLSGEKRLAIHAYRSGKGGRYVRVDLEMADGRSFPILRNVSSWRFDALAQTAPSLGAPLVLVGPMDATPEWVKNRIVCYRIERPS